MSSSPWKRPVSAAWAFFAPRHVPGTITPNLVSAAISTATVLVCCLLFTPQLGMIALMGALTPFWETGRPLWARVRNGLLVSAALTASMSIGVLAAPYRWAVVPVSVLVILVAGLLYYTFMLTRGPSPVMLFYAAVLGTFFGADPSVGWPMVAVTAFASLLTTMFLLIPLAFRPHGPEERAVAAARRAVTAYQEHPGLDDQARRLARHAAYQAVNIAWLTLRSAWPATRNRTHLALRAELTEIDRGLAGTVLQRLGTDPSVRALPPETSLRLGRPGWRFLLAHALRGDSIEWFTAWRMALAAGVAGLVSEAAEIGHPYWAILTATVVINQWLDRATATRRAAHRTVGTLIGVGVVWGLSLALPSPWWVAAAVIACMIGQYLLLPLNYALALIAITPMALLAVEAGGTGESATALGLDRFVDTLIGALTAVAVTWATSHHFPRRIVKSQSARSDAAIRALERTNETGDPFSDDGRRARAHLRHELTHHLSVLDRAVADDPRLADLAPLEHEVADRGHAALGRTWQDRPETVTAEASTR